MPGARIVSQSVDGVEQEAEERSLRGDREGPDPAEPQAMLRLESSGKSLETSEFSGFVVLPFNFLLRKFSNM